MNNKKLIFIILFSLSALVILISIWFIIRYTSPFELDDLHPSIQCDDDLISSSDILWVVPLYENDSIALHPDWCSHILSFNKTIQLHGVYHTYREFGTYRNDDYVSLGVEEFEKCFGFKPTSFKPPQIYYNRINDESLKDNNLSYHIRIYQILRKVYHCSDTGEFKNWVVKAF